MKKRIRLAVLCSLVCCIFYLFFWPVSIEPVSWNAPVDKGYTGPFLKNNLLSELEFLSIGNSTGPEDYAIDAFGQIYAATHEGWIIKLSSKGTDPENWVETGGRPLGIEFDLSGNLIVADSIRGLLLISPDRNIKVLTNSADGIPFGFTDDVDIAVDGKIYFSDATSKYSSASCGGATKASIIDTLEHGGHGRLLVYDPQTAQTKTLLTGLNFANGVAVSDDQRFILVCESGTYRVLRYWIEGPRKGESEPFIENLPGFPDNISKGQNNRYWVALFAPRNPMLDMFSDKPFFRKVIQRLPSFVHPKPIAYGHVIALDDKGKVVKNLQAPHTKYPQNTSVLETDNYLYIGSLSAPSAARVSKKNLNFF